MKLLNKHCLLSVIVAAASVVGAVTVPAVSAEASTTLLPWQREGADPQSSGCAADAITVARYPIESPVDASTLTYLDVRYSPSCGTNWLRMVEPQPLVGDGIQFEIEAGSNLPSPQPYDSDAASSDNGAGQAGHNGTTWWSGMTYAPGGTCITIDAYIYGPQSNYPTVAYLPEPWAYSTIC